MLAGINMNKDAYYVKVYSPVFHKHLLPAIPIYSSRKRSINCSVLNSKKAIKSTFLSELSSEANRESAKSERLLGSKMLVLKFTYFGLRQKKGKGKGSAETAVPRLNHGGAILIQENLIGQQGLERQRRSERNEFLADGPKLMSHGKCILMR
ncbi:hypothetical protein KQX54_003638 [Cotesia glomerata]|uniref:Uncharacterized protein n=1 Tax=Cotesia glomerata TaxID=32391 RepID=A0AAV7J5W6_COTGL|nr:hypothetical protein KQX54_003638 [Cotesia glomerata]